MRIVIMLVASIFLLFANVSAAEASVSNPESLNGEWVGTWTSLNSPTYNGVVQMSINQEGDNVFGTSVLGNTKCSPERVFKGNLSGKYKNFIELELAPEQNPTNPISKNWGVITRSRNAISAVYNFENPTSACYGDVGTMFISKIQPYSKIEGITKK
ncbi:hypothetical protein BJP34_07350 [Moorena producens PAL-8-15-08-1]|uniref:Uncharacterized protein n=1 Tax=Moorena producens PAL-8-15-08-1 TaxID=1458985 RepID=A0A1D8TNR8_9CYAN|nr:hypothetical protein [Moorena producens]AOW99297.1 hypothetical protein BJP34_07350 [Moorena producens PAL-8-15-08-1]